jgi:hypothetical protein
MASELSLQKPQAGFPTVARLRHEKHSIDNSMIAILRLTLDELFTDRRFFARQSMSAGQVAGFILTQIQQGERDLDQLKASAIKKFSGA